MCRHVDNSYYDALMCKIDVKRFFFGEANYYKIQLLHNTAQDIYIVWTRWGRIGDDGQSQKTPFKTLLEAQKEFHKVFRQKTGNDWKDVGQFERVPKKYQLKELEGKAVLKDAHELKFSCRNLSTKKLLRPINIGKAPKSKLPKELQELLTKVVDTKVLDAVP